jgi:hypothetical protein
MGDIARSPRCKEEMALVGCPALVARTVGLDAMPVPEDLHQATLQSSILVASISHRFHSCACRARLHRCPLEIGVFEIDSTIAMHLPDYIAWHKRSCPML